MARKRKPERKRKPLPPGWNLDPAFIPSGNFPPVEARPLTGKAREQAFRDLREFSPDAIEFAKALKNAGMHPRMIDYEPA